LREPYTVEMHHGALPSGTFVGHLLPGIAFMIWGVWWLFELLRDGPAEADAPVERSLFPPVVKMLLLPAAVWLEMPNSGWEPMDAVMGWHHATGYVGFGLSGVVDILARRGMLSARATYLALAAATLNAAVLFYGHGNSAGVEAVMHDFLMLTFMAVGVFALLEIAAPSWPFQWFRAGSMLALGGWLTLTAWILFRSGWDLADHVREGWAYVSYSWLVMAVATLVTMVSLWAGRGAARQRARAS